MMNSIEQLINEKLQVVLEATKKEIASTLIKNTLNEGGIGSGRGKKRLMDANYDQFHRAAIRKGYVHSIRGQNHVYTHPTKPKLSYPVG